MKVSATREKIVETASTLFYNKGYNLTGINEIIAEAGIAKATLYSHFKSKEDICIAYLQHKNDTLLAEIEPFCRSKKEGEAQLIAIFDFLLLFFRDKDFNGCWCLRTIAEIPKDNIRVKTEIQKQKRSLLKFINQLIEDNQVCSNKNKAESLAKQLYLLYESAVGESHLYGENWPIETARNLAKEII